MIISFFSLVLITIFSRPHHSRKTEGLCWKPSKRGREKMVINTREKNDIIIFDIEGEIRRSDISDVTLHQLVKDQLDSGKRNILLNFQNVDFIDSFGVGEILASYISTHNLGGKLKIAKISKKLYIVFQVTMLTKVLDIFDNEEMALESFFKG
jgi:anti-anti-sigma factor